MRNVMIDNPAGISRRVIFYREWKQVSFAIFFFRFGSLKESSGGICRRSSSTDYNVLYGCVMFQPLFHTLHIIFTRYNCLIYVYGRETGAFVAIYPAFQVIILIIDLPLNAPKQHFTYFSSPGV